MRSRTRNIRGWIRLAFALAGTMIASLFPARADGTVSGYVLVHMQPGSDVQKLAQDYNTNVLQGIPATGLYSLKLPNNTTESAFAAQLRTDPRVLYAETDTFVAMPEIGGDPFHMPFDLISTPQGYVTQFAYKQVNLNGSGNSGSGQVNGGATGVTGAGVVVAILDSGVTFNHPALTGHLLAGYNAIQPNLAPWDLPDGFLNEDTGHGTMIAGIIARLAPGAQIMPVRVLNGDGVGTMFNVAQGVHYAVTHGAKIINMSFGTMQSCGALNDALTEADSAGALVVAAAGNNGNNQGQLPAADHRALAVTSVEADNTKSLFSTFGSFVTVVAPGSNIQSAYWTGGYATWSGTSFAAPFVAAEAALLLSAQHNLTTTQVIGLIRNTAHSVDALNPNFRSQLGHGLIDIQAALTSQSNSGSSGGSGSGSGH